MASELTFEELAGKLCSIPRATGAISEDERARLVHADLDGCTPQQAMIELMTTVVALHLYDHPWLVERTHRLQRIARSKRGRTRG